MKLHVLLVKINSNVRLHSPFIYPYIWFSLQLAQALEKVVVFRYLSYPHTELDCPEQSTGLLSKSHKVLLDNTIYNNKYINKARDFSIFFYFLFSIFYLKYNIIYFSN